MITHGSFTEALYFRSHRKGTTLLNHRFIRLIALLLAFICLVSAVGCAEGREESNSGTASSADSTAGPADLPTETEGTPKKRVALTFDDGPQHYEERTKEIVNELAKYGFTATFFVVGNRIPGGNALAYAVEHGCELGIHGYTHLVYYDTCTDAEYEKELDQTRAAIEKAVPGYDVRLMRPVGGRISSAHVAAAPYSVIMWNVDSNDWAAENRYTKGDTAETARAKVERIVDGVMNAVTDGDVILMHDIYESTYDATVLLLARLYAEGYEVVSVSDLFGDKLEAGKKYYNLS